MELNRDKNNRIYAFDQLRAIMMLLGLVIHAGSTYVVRDISNQWPVKDLLSTSLFFEMILGLVHLFRMPVFFIVAGFFTAMLFYVKGPENMLRNRLKRVFFPFVAGVMVLYPVYLLAVSYFRFRTGIEVESLQEIIEMKIRSGWRGIQTIHLWFLYYLFMYCIAAWVVCRCASISPGISQKVKNCFKFAFNSNWAPLIFAPVTVLCLADARSILTLPAVELTPNLNCFFTHGYFFFFGWLLYPHRDCLGRFLKQDKLFSVIGLCMFFIALFLVVTYPDLEITYGYFFYVWDAIISWCFIFGFTGLALRYLNHYSAVGRYVSDASYWVYLVHFPLIIFFQGMLVNFHLHGLIKFGVSVLVTALVSLVSYNYIVRDTFIGKALSGRKFKRGLPKPDFDGPVVVSR